MRSFSLVEAQSPGKSVKIFWLIPKVSIVTQKMFTLLCWKIRLGKCIPEMFFT